MNDYKQLKNLVAIIVILIISLVFSSCQKPTETRPSYFDYIYQVPDQTNDGWETAHLSDVNISEAPLVWMMREYFGTRTRDVHSILIIKERIMSYASKAGTRKRGQARMSLR